MIAWWVGWALAQAPQFDDGALYVEGVEEVVVVGDHVVAAARAAVIRKLEGLGWKVRRERNGEIILRAPEAWMGKARLTAYGDLVLGTPVVAVNGPREAGGGYDPEMATNNDQQAGTVGIELTPFPGRRKVEAVHAEVRAAVDEDVVAWREALRKRALGRQLEELPDRLAALWERGEGLDRTHLEGWEARRRALLAYWASRTDTVEGRAVSRMVEDFLREVVWSSPNPLTAEEIAWAEAMRADGRVLDLPPRRGTMSEDGREGSDVP